MRLRGRLNPAPLLIVIVSLTQFQCRFVSAHGEEGPDFSAVKEALKTMSETLEKSFKKLDDKLGGIEQKLSKIGKGSDKPSAPQEQKHRRRRRGSKAKPAPTPAPKPTPTKESERRRRRTKKKSSPPPSPPPPPPATKADAKPSKIEAGWGDMAKRGTAFTLFVLGSGFEPKKDRVVVVHGDDSCGGSARVAQVTGNGEVPSGLDGWASLACDGITSGDGKLACGDGSSTGVKFPDDNWVDTYDFKVCVCDHSKRNSCSSMGDFDVTPGRPKLTVNSVV